MRINLREAKKLLLQGEVIAIPTETVYGIAACLNNLHAVQKVYELKGRSENKPLPVLVENMHQLSSLITELPSGSKELMRRFWPGPLTLVLRANTKAVPESVRAGLPNVGVRMPDHPLAISLIREVGPVVAPSANFSGKPSATSPEQVEQEFGDDFPILDGGPCSFGVASTIVRFSNGKREVLRKGAIEISSE